MDGEAYYRCVQEVHVKPLAPACMMAVVLAGCGGSGGVEPPGSPSSLGFSVSVQVAESVEPDGQDSLSLSITVRDGMGLRSPIVGGAVSVRDSSGGLLARAEIPDSRNGQAAVALSWREGAALQRSLDLSISVRDAAGTIHVLERTLADAASEAGAERARRLFDLALDAPSPADLAAARRRPLESGLVDLGRRNRARRDDLFDHLAHGWLGESGAKGAAGLARELARAVEALASP